MTLNKNIEIYVPHDGCYTDRIETTETASGLHLPNNFIFRNDNTSEDYINDYGVMKFKFDENEPIIPQIIEKIAQYLVQSVNTPSKLSDSKLSNEEKLKIENAIYRQRDVLLKFNELLENDKIKKEYIELLEKYNINIILYDIRMISKIIENKKDFRDFFNKNILMEIIRHGKDYFLDEEETKLLPKMQDFKFFISTCDMARLKQELYSI